MSVLGRIYEATINTLIVAVALFKILLGLAMIGACVGALYLGFNFADWGVILGVFCILGVIIIVTSLGVFVSAPSPERNAKRETRKALRRARMLQR